MTPDETTTTTTELNALVAQARQECGSEALAWGVVLDGWLAMSGGIGATARTVFRIASMTKSFTAATILAFRDAGELRLDDEVPLLAGVRATTDSPPITYRHLLTMSSGLPEDDAWADRHMDWSAADIEALIAGGLRFAHPTGTAFEYSNLGYGILGRVISNAAGAEYREVVERQLLGPLGMRSTAFQEEDAAADRLAHGYVRRDDEYLREGTDAYGAFASMGGLYSTVRDLATWVAGFLDAVPSRSDPEKVGPGSHPLRRATRREMQQLQRSFSVEVESHAPDAVPPVSAGGYGFGLFVTQDPDLGTFVGHSGGYPGYGSNMTWHPATGLGIVALSNLRYAGPSGLVGELLSGLVRDGVVPRRRVRAMPAVERARKLAEGLVARWDDDVADAAFAMNMDLDEPRAARQAAVEAAVRDYGPFRPDPERPVTSWSAAHLRWWLRGDRGWLRLELLVSPEPEPRIQALRLQPVGDPSPALLAVAERLLEEAATAEADGRQFVWPQEIPCTSTVDAGAVRRAFVAGGARFGSLALGRVVDGDGRTATEWSLVTERGGAATLRVALEPGSGTVSAVALRVAAREPPEDAW
jgi:CubicO group peptidase (beta-lactamase class C family)